MLASLATIALANTVAIVFLALWIRALMREDRLAEIVSCQQEIIDDQNVALEWATDQAYRRSMRVSNN